MSAEQHRSGSDRRQFLRRGAATGAGTSKPYHFKPFVPRLPEPLGAIHSFAG